jgi:RHS repeat-associated protein
MSISNRYKFTGKERDAESGNDYFGARYYGSSMGRFMSPDPSGLVYADPTNPQSFNLYSYVRNNPLVFTDPTGRQCEWDDGSYDAADDPNTGKQADCESAGGRYVDPQTAGEIGMKDWSADPNKQYALPDDPNSISVNASPSDIPLTGSFNFDDMTKDQFIAMMQKSGFSVSTLDTLMPFHPGLNLRDSSSTCSIHLILDPFAGQYGNPVSGQFHIDEFNPLKRGPMPVPQVFYHFDYDVVPEVLHDTLQMQGVTPGNRNCPHS